MPYNLGIGGSFSCSVQTVTSRDSTMTVMAGSCQEQQVFCFETAPRNRGQIRNYNSISSFVLGIKLLCWVFTAHIKTGADNAGANEANSISIIKGLID